MAFASLFRTSSHAVLTVAAGAVAMAVAGPAAAQLEVVFGVQGGDFERFDYEIGLLDLALQKSGVPYSLDGVPFDGNQDRLVFMVESGDTFDVVFAGANQEREQRLRQVPVPLQRGLLGHRVLITNDESAPTLAAVASFEDLQQVTIGSGTGWPDTEILQQAGLNVSDSDYQSLFRLTAAGRVDGYGRGVHEAFAEVTARADEMPNLTVDDRVLIVYPFDSFFFVRNDDDALYDALLSGLLAAYEDGSFMAYFEGHPRIQQVFADANMDERVVFRLENPLLTEATASIDDRFWHQVEGVAAE